MPAEHDHDPLQLSDDARFMLGEINATVKHTAQAVSDLRLEMMANMSGFNTRLQELERQFAHRTGVRTTAVAMITGIATFVASCFSGLLTYFISRAH
jgi:hypothetical protein